jgi:class 3 adenylate cyclase
MMSGGAPDWRADARPPARRGNPLARPVAAFVRAGVALGDPEPLRRQKAILMVGVALKVACCPMWVIGYGLPGFYLAAAAPLAYMGLSALSTARFVATRDFGAYSTRQIALMLALPAAMQLALGGYVPASAVILWSLLAPLMALLFRGARSALPWIAAFVGLAAVSGLLELVGLPPPAPTPEPLRQAFFVLNVGVVGVIICAIVRYFAARLEQEQARSEALLLNLLPASIAQRLKDGEEPIADSYPDVTVLFADLVGFTGLTTRVAPAEMVGLLNRIFSAFDALAQRHGLEKIKTIGDGYHAAAGVPVARPDHAEAAAEMALDMRDAVRALARECGWPLRVRIGLDSGGPVLAGVIGTRKFVYDLWGDVVNTASRMESHGLPDTIQVTEGAYRRLRGAYAFEERGLIEVKGKERMRTYLLTGRGADERAEPASGADVDAPPAAVAR